MIDDDGIDVCLIHPWELSDTDWIEINEQCQKFAMTGEEDFLKCCVLGYVEWLALSEINGVKQ